MKIRTEPIETVER